jgi:hypothetical protein
MYNKNLEYLMSYNVDEVMSQKSVLRRKKLYPLLRRVMILTNPYKLHIIRKSELPKDRPLIFTPNHGFKDDLLNAMIVADRHFYILFGSYDQFYYTFDGQLANLFGVVMVNRDDPKSKETAIPKMIKAIEYGTNALIFPEGCWNLTDSELIMKLYSGFYRLAVSTNALIVPIGLHIEGKNCYAIRDNVLDITKLTLQNSKDVLRDKMSTLQYELIEKYSGFSRKKLENCGLSLKEQWEYEKARRKSQVKYYIEEKEINYPFNDSTGIEYEAVMADIERVERKYSLFPKR